jgi:hypothetical protein
VMQQKCIVAECRNIVRPAHLFCADCWSLMGSSARQRWRLYFPWWKGHNWNVFDERERVIVMETIEAVRFARSQLCLFDEMTNLQNDTLAKGRKQ